MSGKYGHVPEEKLALYKQLIDAHPEIELRGGTKLPYTSLNGNMFSQLTKAGTVGLRLGKAEREAFLAEFDSELLMNYGTVMKEYVAVPDHLLRDTARLLPYLELSYAYAKTLVPHRKRRLSAKTQRLKREYENPAAPQQGELAMPAIELDVHDPQLNDVLPPPQRNRDCGGRLEVP